MLKSSLLKSSLFAGLFFLSANFLPTTFAGVPKIIAGSVPLAGPSTKVAAVPVQTARGAKPMLGMVKAQSQKVILADGVTAEEMDLIARTNAERTARGLNALVLDPLLTATARGHSLEMCARDYFDHHSPTPGIATPMDRYLSALHGLGDPTPRYVLVGENIFFCSATTAIYNGAYGHQAFMNSPGHRANILEGRFTKIGIGVYRDAAGRFWITEMFLRDDVTNK